MLTSVIDTFEEHDVATVDIPGPFLQAKIDENVHIRMTDAMVEGLKKFNPKYDNYAIHKGNKGVQ
jgi:hypothetical protein